MINSRVPATTSIQYAISQREITRVLHFLPSSSLVSVFELGAILSRKNLAKKIEELPEMYLEDYVQFNDNLRMDALPDHISTSIQRPNTYLLNSFSKRWEDQVYQWCIVSMNTDILLQEGTLFSVSNAASTASKSYGIDEGVKHFEALFLDRITTKQGTFDRTFKQANEPTDIQAEALVKGSISTNLIEQVFFKNEKEANHTRSAIRALLDDIELPPFTVDESLFKHSH